MRGHNDEAEDRALFGKMLKKAMPHKKVMKHLKSDVKEQKHGISEDKKLMKSMHHGEKKNKGNKGKGY